MILQSDQELGIIDVKHKVVTQIPTEIVREERPVGDSNSNGIIKRANQTIQGQIRAIKDFTERQIDKPRQRYLDVACTTFSMVTNDVPCWRRWGVCESSRRSSPPQTHLVRKIALRARLRTPTAGARNRLLDSESLRAHPVYGRHGHLDSMCGSHRPHSLSGRPFVQRGSSQQ